MTNQVLRSISCKNFNQLIPRDMQITPAELYLSRLLAELLSDSFKVQLTRILLLWDEHNFFFFLKKKNCGSLNKMRFPIILICGWNCGSPAVLIVWNLVDVDDVCSLSGWLLKFAQLKTDSVTQLIGTRIILTGWQIILQFEGSLPMYQIAHRSCCRITTFKLCASCCFWLQQLTRSYIFYVMHSPCNDQNGSERIGLIR